MMIETERLVLRNYRESDLDDYYEYVSSPLVGPMCGWQPYDSIEKAKERLAKEVTKPLQFAVLLKSENKVIGSIELMEGEKIHEDYSLDKTVRCKEIGCLLSEKYWGKGYMTEAERAMVKFAFTQFNLDCVVSGYFAPNTGSAKVQAKALFKPYQKLEKCYKWLDGSDCDLIMCKITKNEYENSDIYKNLPLKIIEEKEMEE